ncbi:MAG: acyl carrier protein [Bacteroidota bacterium]
MDSIELRIKNIMSLVLKIDHITDDFKIEDTEKWDSLQHMNLIAVLEDEFDISFNNDEIVDMKSYTLVLDKVRQHLANEQLNG